jgi:hypothetical protein
MAMPLPLSKISKNKLHHSYRSLATVGTSIAKRKINRKAATRQRKRPDAVERAENSMLVAAAGIPAV